MERNFAFRLREVKHEDRGDGEVLVLVALLEHGRFVVFCKAFRINFNFLWDIQQFPVKKCNTLRIDEVIHSFLYVKDIGLVILQVTYPHARVRDATACFRINILLIFIMADSAHELVYMIGSPGVNLSNASTNARCHGKKLAPSFGSLAVETDLSINRINCSRSSSTPVPI